MSQKKTKKASLKKGSRKITGKTRHTLKGRRKKGAAKKGPAKKGKRRGGVARKRLTRTFRPRRGLSREYHDGYAQGYREGHAKGFEDAHQDSYINHSDVNSAVMVS